jgi:acid phosphatase
MKPKFRAGKGMKPDFAGPCSSPARTATSAEASAATCFETPTAKPVRGAPRGRCADLLVSAVLLSVCASTRVLADEVPHPPAVRGPHASALEALRADIQTIVVIYAENRAFDNLYGNFPGAHGLGEVVDAHGAPLQRYVPQRDRDGTLLPVLPQTWGGVTAAGYSPVVTQAESAGLPNAPFSVERAFTAQSHVVLTTASVTRDLYHRFFEHQMQIDGGRNDQYAAWADAGGLTMGHFDTARSALYSLARQFVLADDFFQGAFGGSFLNHQYLICACAPEYPDADTAAAHPSFAILDRDSQGHYLPRLTVAQDSPTSALDGPPKFLKSGNIAPADYFGDGKFYAINTMQPPYQPSGNGPPDGADLRYADPAKSTTLPPQTRTTIGDLLTARGVAWAWYAGAWDLARADGQRPAKELRTAIYTPNVPAGSPDFQPHHQPFNYYSSFDPKAHADARALHLKDYDDLVADAAAGRLPAVAFYKPQGNLNQHEGYASILEGDAHLAKLVAALEAGPQWNHMLIVVTYDEYGGVWDHVPPPHGDLLGPGARIPALIISPYARHGTVDHTPYDTESILKLITRRFDLPVLPGIVRRDAALAAHGEPPMGDLTGALSF